MKKPGKESYGVITKNVRRTEVLREFAPTTPK